MPPLNRMLEVAVYSLLNFLPFLALAIYPFRHSLRFSGAVTGLLIGLLTAIQLFLGAWVAFLPGDNAGTVSAVSTILYAAFYFLAVKQYPGKTFFTLLMISNMANLAVMAAKCLEGQLFPSLAAQGYRWSFSLMLLAVELALAVPLVIYMKNVYTSVLEKEPAGLEWRYLWLVPATFYVVWYHIFYGNTSLSSLEIALRPKNTLILLIINIGEVLVYYVVAQLILEQNKLLELKEHNYQLSMQTLQYEKLKEKIAEARRAKHDVCHHIAVMQEYLSRGEYAALASYLDEYGRSLPDDSPVRFCENAAANAVLLHFAQRAKEEGVAYLVRTDIPQDIAVSDTDISVLLGNLLENALDACKAEHGDNRRVAVRAGLTGGALCITVDNTCTGRLRYAPSGALLSTKHRGLGMGTQSVRSIAEKYGGVCRFEAGDGMFYASVLCGGV